MNAKAWPYYELQLFALQIEQLSFLYLVNDPPVFFDLFRLKNYAVYDFHLLEERRFPGFSGAQEQKFDLSLHPSLVILKSKN